MIHVTVLVIATVIAAVTVVVTVAATMAVVDVDGTITVDAADKPVSYKWQLCHDIK